MLALPGRLLRRHLFHLWRLLTPGFLYARLYLPDGLIIETPCDEDRKMFAEFLNTRLRAEKPLHLLIHEFKHRA